MMKSLRLLLLLPLGLLALALDLAVPPPPLPGAVGPYLNGVFPSSAPGEDGAWVLEDRFPDFSFRDPLRLKPWPTSDELLLLTKVGKVWRLSLAEQKRTLLLDLTDRTFKLGEGGAVGMALHPHFGNPAYPDHQTLFVFYRHKPNPEQWSEQGFNRLSKFRWDAPNQRFDPSSEEILIQQYDRSTWHNGGAMFFGPKGYLYLSVGDEGAHDYQAASTQSLRGGLFSGILRLDVDNDTTRSHPIRRQPNHVEPPTGWGETFTQGYSIPDDNPWLDEQGGILEEFYAIGLRSPYAMYFDPESEAIWVADVGTDKQEEISLVRKGDNLQWPYREGSYVSETHLKPDSLIGSERGIYYEYDRSVGACIMGGSIYRGTKFPALYGKYLFADYMSNRLMSLTHTGSQSEPVMEQLLYLGNQTIDYPASPGITGVFPQPDGEILVTVMGAITTNTGRIYALKRSAAVSEPPSRLSELGAFIDLDSLTPAPGLIPYEVNAPLWSDRATKRRWMAIPNDGSYDTPEEQIRFSSLSEWDFPEGTVFIKHFELPLGTEPDAPTARLETRFFVLGANGSTYGLTYQWNEAGTEAYLLGGGASRDFDITEGGDIAFTQTWDYPSREQCLSCHNANAGSILGVKTHQLNGTRHDPTLDREINQLMTLNEWGVFAEGIHHHEAYLKAHPIDDPTVDLDLRIRSSLAANCASCHRPGGVPGVSLDLRFATPLELQNMVNQPTASRSSEPGRMIVLPGDHAQSELWVRDASHRENRMPPIGRNLVDETYVEALATWIDGLPDDVALISRLKLYPNPSEGQFSLRLPDHWAIPYRIRVFDHSGREVHKQESRDLLTILDLHKLPAGVYLLEAQSGGDRNWEKLIIR